MKLSKRKIIAIIKNGSIDSCTLEEREQVFEFAFGKKYMASQKKGVLQEY